MGDEPLLSSHIESNTLCQNLARKRALEFGKSELTNIPGHGEEIAVSTAAEPSEVNHHHLFPSAFEHKPRGFFADQFENDSNFMAHYKGTGPEILRQTSGNLDGFVSGAGKYGWSFPITTQQ